MYYKTSIYVISLLILAYLTGFIPNNDSVTSNIKNANNVKKHAVSTKQQLVTPKPWENNPNFKETISENGTFELMGEYQATLKDPLPGEMYNVSHAANMLAGTVIQPGEIFSQNKKLGPYEIYKGYQEGPMYKGTNIVKSTGGGVCKIASLLYNVATLSNMQIIERYNHSMTVPYVPPGQDATVYYGVKDFRFKNITKGPIVIWAQTVDNTLHMAIYGQEKPPKVTWHHKTLKHIKYWDVYRNNPELPKKTQKVIIPGQDGFIVSTWLTIEYPDGKKETKKLWKDYYNPLPQLIEKGI